MLVISLPIVLQLVKIKQTLIFITNNGKEQSVTIFDLKNNSDIGISCEILNSEEGTIYKALNLQGMHVKENFSKFETFKFLYSDENKITKFEIKEFILDNILNQKTNEELFSFSPKEVLDQTINNKADEILKSIKNIFTQAGESFNQLGENNSVEISFYYAMVKLLGKLSENFTLDHFN